MCPAIPREMPRNPIRPRNRASGCVRTRSSRPEAVTRRRYQQTRIPIGRQTCKKTALQPPPFLPRHVRGLISRFLREKPRKNSSDRPFSRSDGVSDARRRGVFGREVTLLLDPRRRKASERSEASGRASVFFGMGDAVGGGGYATGLPPVMRRSSCTARSPVVDMMAATISRLALSETFPVRLTPLRFNT